MILIINTCKEKLHYYEFVKPIEDILKNKSIKFKTTPHKKIKESDIKKSTKIIISGTSLKDNAFLKDLKKFSFIKNTDNPILGICAGMQIIGQIYGGIIKTKTEIGFYHEFFKEDFLGLKGKEEVYHLHHNYIDFSKLDDFNDFSEENSIIQAIKHKEKKIYGVIFHPEVRQKEMILNFCKT
jgi:anthranilate/para-aminobenzoate synthase component II